MIWWKTSANNSLSVPAAFAPGWGRRLVQLALRESLFVPANPPRPRWVLLTAPARPLLAPWPWLLAGEPPPPHLNAPTQRWLQSSPSKSQRYPRQLQHPPAGTALDPPRLLPPRGASVPLPAVRQTALAVPAGRGVCRRRVSTAVSARCSARHRRRGPGQLRTSGL